MPDRSRTGRRPGDASDEPVGDRATRAADTRRMRRWPGWSSGRGGQASAAGLEAPAFRRRGRGMGRFGMTTVLLGIPRLELSSSSGAGRPDTPALVDRYGRIATDFRVSVTDRCNLRCSYCMPAEGGTGHPLRHCSGPMNGLRRMGPGEMFAKVIGRAVVAVRMQLPLVCASCKWRRSADETAGGHDPSVAAVESRSTASPARRSEPGAGQLVVPRAR